MQERRKGGIEERREGGREGMILQINAREYKDEDHPRDVSPSPGLGHTLYPSDLPWHVVGTLMQTNRHQNVEASDDTQRNEVVDERLQDYSDPKQIVHSIECEGPTVRYVLYFLELNEHFDVKRFKGICCIAVKRRLPAAALKVGYLKFECISTKLHRCGFTCTSTYLSSIAPFDCDIDDFVLRIKWEKWKRSLKILRNQSHMQQSRIRYYFIMGEVVCKKYTLAYKRRGQQELVREDYSAIK
nr:unnamed protein product [Callosobruchus analis]